MLGVQVHDARLANAEQRQSVIEVRLFEYEPDSLKNYTMRRSIEVQ